LTFKHGVKRYTGAWLYDRIIGSRKTGIGYRANNPKYDRSKLNHDNMKDKLVDNCPCCGVSMNYGRGYNKMYNEVRGIVARPSLDRIDNNLGYEPSNVRVICESCNTIKNDRDYYEQSVHLR
jgi:RNase P subunit RPR2